MRSVTGLITGLHEPQATHLMLLEQVVASGATVGSQRSAAPAIWSAPTPRRASAGYLWHEFGDSHLIIGGKRDAVIGRTP